MIILLKIGLTKKILYKHISYAKSQYFFKLFERVSGKIELDLSNYMTKFG